MSVVEDTRKVLRDFLAPELRAIAVRLDAVEKRFDGIDRRFDQVEIHADKRHDTLLMKIDKVADSISLRERMARLEERLAPHQ